MNTTNVILVDENDNPSGVAEKMSAHTGGLLHRAFSVFLFNAAGDMLLQQRAKEKYHSGGLWTNAVCSHPAPGEKTIDAVTRRIHEELGITVQVTKIFDFIYRAELQNGLTEYEFDHVYAGEFQGTVNFDQAEVMNIQYLPMTEIKESIVTDPQRFTAWFLIAFPKVEEWWKMKYGGLH